jgi:hypothetical protein
MPAKFRLLGPFELKQANGSPPMGSLKNLWSSPHGKVGEIPRSATGVYIFAIKMGSKHLPIYVGLSDHGFAPRLNNHKIYKKIAEVYPLRDIYLFLIARVTPRTGKFILRKRNAEGKVIARRANRELEFLLIGSCLRKNPNLLNSQEKSFLRGLVVPGYHGSPKDLTSGPVEFRQMLDQ